MQAAVGKVAAALTCARANANRCDQEDRSEWLLLAAGMKIGHVMFIRHTGGIGDGST
jgi:hypothetical protein